jgi:hypothetical protein
MKGQVLFPDDNHGHDKIPLELQFKLIIELLIVNYYLIPRFTELRSIMKFNFGEITFCEI